MIIRAISRICRISLLLLLLFHYFSQSLAAYLFKYQVLQETDDFLDERTYHQSVHGSFEI